MGGRKGERRRWNGREYVPNITVFFRRFFGSGSCWNGFFEFLNWRFEDSKRTRERSSVEDSLFYRAGGFIMGRFFFIRRRLRNVFFLWRGFWRPGKEGVLALGDGLLGGGKIPLLQVWLIGLIDWMKMGWDAYTEITLLTTTVLNNNLRRVVTGMRFPWWVW